MDIILGSDGASLFALIDDDLFHMVKVTARDKCIFMGEIAKELGVTRAHFYRIFLDKKVRIDYLIQLQNLLDLELINQSDINKGLCLIATAARERYALH